MSNTKVTMNNVIATARPDIKRFPLNKDESHKSWKLFSKNSHILGSQCNNKEKCQALDNIDDKCQFCIFEHKMSLPHLPDMVFADNILHLSHESGAAIEFCALGALQQVSPDKVDLEVACAQAWRDVRKGCTFLEEDVKNPFDWTFTTQYAGTLLGDIQVESTSERIDLDKLRQKDQILFYQDITLFEDELHDNGIALCSVKIRMMPDSFYVLLRFFLRVDGVLVRVNDTRIYHEFGWSYLLREFTSRQAKFSDNTVDVTLWKDPDGVANMLPLVLSRYEKLNLPDKKTE